MDKVSLRDNGASFEVTLLEAARPSRLIVFAVGSGGNPERHLPLLTSLAEQGYTVIAPHFERLASPRPTEEELLLRARRLRLALDSAARPNMPVVGVGHSIGATILVALAGGQLWMHAGRQVPVAPDERLSRLLLLTPATGFFQAPGALDAVRAPTFLWAGTNDVITPPDEAEFLKRQLEGRVAVELRLVDGAGHFSFMNTLPPQISDPHPDRETFLTNLATEILIAVGAK